MELPQHARIIAGRYALESLIGEGGMASVYRARDMTLERPVAVKLLFARDERDKQRLVQQFLREARIAASVHHRNVIQIADFGSLDGQQPYMVMELLEGETLGHRMHREPRLSVIEVVQIATLTLRGLTAVHDAGIIHRDLKPDNIYLARDGAGGVYPKILDFGISRSIEPRSGRRSALTTREGMIVGTPEYMSPEQARGVRGIDRRSDLYSMGAIMYEALCGRLPFANENVGDLIIQIVTGSLQDLSEVAPDVPDAIAAVVHKAMSRLADDRFQDAMEMQAALTQAAEQSLPSLPGTLSEAPPSGLSRSGRQPIERLRTLEFSLDEQGGEHEPAPVDGVEPDTFPRPPKLPDFGERASLGRVLGATAVVALLVGAGAAWLTREHQAPAVAPSVATGHLEETRPSAPPPEAAPTGPIKVELTGVPKGATVSVDGTAVPGDVLELPRDRRNRVIRVSAPGKASWQAVHHASADATYEVLLADNPSPVLAAPAKHSAPAARPKSRARAPEALRNLDF